MEKDITEKLLADYDDVFADIINGLIFEGEQRVLPDQLTPARTRSQYKADDKIHEQERDVSKYWSISNVKLAIYGVENQTDPERLMPLRIIGYDGASYRGQLLRKEKPSPVVTIILYFGKEHWTQPQSLLELLNVPTGLERYVNDYRIHVFEISWLTDEEISRFKSDFKIVANFFARKRRSENYIPDDPSEIVHVDEVLKLLSVFSNDHHYEEIISSGQEVHNMCEVAERLINMGMEQGIERGIEQGIERGRLEVLLQFTKDGLITLDEAMKRSGLTEEQFREYKKHFAL